ncbi:MAG: PaaI family thioesterase [Deltaproteobacteria bacterium]|nr:PaaI family thioesterase [Deltaproteobacteria bacterium]RLB29577.1 MAG: PaaI family thioesterase [Deltaproteobacteria bacterium]
MRKLNPDYVEIAKRYANTCPYFELISLELKDIRWGECRIELAVAEKHLQPFGNVHGGVFSSLVDATTFWAVFSQIEEDVGMTTVELKLNYLAPVSTGRMIGKGKSIRVGKTLCLGEATIEDEKGDILAHGTSTMMILKNLKFQGKEKWPPKFLD